mgnify:CR=1 FL=1
MIGRLRAVLRERRRRILPLEFRALRGAPIDADAVALWGFVHAPIGLGTSARGYARLLRDIVPQARVHALTLRDRDTVPFVADPPTRRSGRNIVVLNPPELLDGNRRFPNSLMTETHRIGYWVWELPHMPNDWVPALDLVDEIWTCSTFCATAFAGRTAKPVHVLPHVVEDWDHVERDTARRTFGLPTDDTTIFLTVFDFSSGFHRKNPIGTIAAFRKAFGDGPAGPILVLKFHSSGRDPAAGAALAAAAEPCPRIRAIDAALPSEALHTLFDACDCFVSLHRSEGFGLNLAEAMMADRPVIATAYSGNTDFLSPDDGYPVEASLVPVPTGHYASHVGQTWAEPSLDCAIEWMRTVAGDPSAATARGRRGHTAVVDRLGSAAIGRRLRELLQAE